MSLIQNIFGKSQLLLNTCEKLTPLTTIGCRNASKKTGGSTKNQRGKVVLPKFRGLKRQEGDWVSAGTMIVTQRTLNYMPGLNVGFGKNGTLFAMEPGTVKITSEKCELNPEHTWVQRLYGGEDITYLYKKYVHVIHETQHNRFKLVDSV